MTSALRLVSMILLMVGALLVTRPGSAQDHELREGGIIGTGIVGTVTELGSIWVNGQHVRFPDDLGVDEGMGLRLAGEIRPGHTVAVIATPEASDWRAQYIRQILPLVGPVSRIEGGELTILGTRIIAPGNVRGVAPGDWLAVSGLWREGEVIASRLEKLSIPPGEASVTGTYLGRDSRGRALIGSVAIAGIVPQHLQPGDVVRATGRPGADGSLQTTRIEVGIFASPVALIQAEGYVSPPRPDGLYTVLGSGLISYTDHPDEMSTRARTILCGKPGAMTGARPSEFTTSQQALSRRLGCEPF